MPLDVQEVEAVTVHELSIGAELQQIKDLAAKGGAAWTLCKFRHGAAWQRACRFRAAGADPDELLHELGDVQLRRLAHDWLRKREYSSFAGWVVLAIRNRRVDELRAAARHAKMDAEAPPDLAGIGRDVGGQPATSLTPARLMALAAAGIAAGTGEGLTDEDRFVLMVQMYTSRQGVRLKLPFLEHLLQKETPRAGPGRPTRWPDGPQSAGDYLRGTLQHVGSRSQDLASEDPASEDSDGRHDATHNLWG